jgi:hypothetical protein
MVQEHLAVLWDFLPVADKRRFAPLRYMGIFHDAHFPPELIIKREDVTHPQWQKRSRVAQNEIQAHDRFLAEEYFREYWKNLSLYLLQLIV